MLVKMRTEVSGLRDGQPWPPRGGVIELPTDEAMTLCANGSALPVYDAERSIETAVVLPGEEMREVVIEGDGHVDTSARDALVATARPLKKVS